MTKKIAILAGDGIGEEVMTQAVRVLNTIAHKFNHNFNLMAGKIGGVAFDHYGEHFPKSTQQLCLEADAILFGAVGGPVANAHLEKWHNCEANSILALRQLFKLSTNIRPISVYPELLELCPLKKSVINGGIDIIIIRELIGDSYFGTKRCFVQDNIRYAHDTAEYNEQQIATVAHQAFQLAQQRSGTLISVDKANVLVTSQLWRQVMTEIGQQYPNVTLKHMLVDNCALQLVINPKQFDVIVTSNLFGDILSDVAAALPGSLGLLPSASINATGFGLYEPCGGSAPDIAGKNIANPIAQILSVALLLRHSFKLETESLAIEQAVRKTLAQGYYTADLTSSTGQWLGTQQMTDMIVNTIENTHY